MEIIRKSVIEICQEFHLKEDDVEMFISEEWIKPFKDEGPVFDHEDVARIELICELRNDLDVNDEAIPIILNLLDQIHLLRAALKQRRQ